MTERGKPPGAGHGTFDLVDRRRIFEELALGPSTVLLDLGCGRGDYTVPVAEAIGPEGKVYGVDAWEEGLAELQARLLERGLNNVKTLFADANSGLPLEDRSVDVCLMATVLHDILREGTGEVALGEIARVLKPGGRLAIVEFKKIADGPGPPLRVRLSESEVEGVIKPFGFQKDRVTEAGTYHYLFMATLQNSG